MIFSLHFPEDLYQNQKKRSKSIFFLLNCKILLEERSPDLNTMAHEKGRSKKAKDKHNEGKRLRRVKKERKEKKRLKKSDAGDRHKKLPYNPSQVKCTYCKQWNDHYSQHCSNADISEVLISTIQCTVCQGTIHSNSECPYRWRKYITKETSINFQKRIVPMHRIYCYKCGQKGHYGGDCVLKKPIQPGIATAFTGRNLAPSLTEVYFNQLDNPLDDEESVIHRKPKIRRFNFYPPPYKSGIKYVEDI